jgi:hypothetical protein
VVFAALLCRIPCAVLHVHAASRASFWRKAPFMALALAARWPVVFHLHGGGFADFYEHECGPRRRALVHFFLERAACIAVLSVRWGAWIRGIVPAARVVCVPNVVTLPPHPGGVREPGTIAFVGDTINPKTRRVMVRCQVPNRGGRLKPEMYATVALGESGPRTIVAVPSQSVHEVEGRTVVFVQTGDRFTRRDVHVGSDVNGLMEIRSGLKAGERVAAAGSFLLKSELLRQTMPEG